MWTIIHGFWTLVARQYDQCLDALASQDKSADQLRAQLPLLAARSIAAQGVVLKWDHFHYAPISGDAWKRLGRPYLMAQAAGVGDWALQLYPGQAAQLTPAGEYLKVLAFHASSLECLLPKEIELAERLIIHLLPDLVLAGERTPGSVYWVDAGQPQPPMRLARQPLEQTPGLRFLAPGSAGERLAALIQQLEREEAVPASLNLGSSYGVRAVLPVLRHLAAYWAPQPPQRQHERHRVKHRVAVLPGLVNTFVVFSPDFGGRPMGLPLESWIVENVSRGGFGATVQEVKGDWLKVGALLALQAEGADNWVVGVVRRYLRLTDREAQIGIETLSRRVASVEVRPLAASSYAIGAVSPGLWLQDDNAPDETRLILPVNTFAQGETLEFDAEGRRLRLEPLALLEQGGDYEVARYRMAAG